MEAKTVHTETPWQVDSYGNIEGIGGESIATVNIWDGEANLANGRDLPESQANAAFIIRACNAYQLMLDALKEARQQIEYLHDKFTATGTGNAVIAQINTALTAAEQA